MLVCAAVLYRGSIGRAQTPPAPEKPAAAAQTTKPSPPGQAQGAPATPVQSSPPVAGSPVVVGSQPDSGLEFKPGSDTPLPVVKPVLPPSAPPASAPAGKAGQTGKVASVEASRPSASKAGEAVGPASTPGPVAAQPAPSQAKGTKRGKDSQVAAAAAPSAASGPYVIGPLDVLEIKIWNDPRLSGIFDVRPDGMISMNLIGEMKADGLTPAELTDVVKRKLAATVMNDEDPPVLIQVARINSKKYSIIGGCLRNGDFPLIGATTVLDALVNCGGFKEFANQKKIYELRGSTKYPFNYKDAINGRRPEQNIYLQNGDRVVVPE